MTDLLLPLNELLKGHNAPSITATSYSLERINEFLKEAYSINQRTHELLAYLRQIRQPYLSAAPPPRRNQLRNDPNTQQQQIYLTDVQRDEIDAEAKSVLRDLHAAVNGLSQGEEVRQQTIRTIAESRRRRAGGGFLASWAAGGGMVEKSPKEEVEEAKNNTLSAHRRGVIWFLQERLEKCGRVQSSMMEIRSTREVEKNKSLSYLSKAGRPISLMDEGSAFENSGILIEELQGGGEEDLSDEQQRQFAMENRDMLKHYDQKLDQVRKAEQSLVEISELQSTLAANLEIQSAHIDQLVQDSYLTTENVGQGNKELKKASERKSTAKMVFYATVGTCAALTLFDLAT